MKLWEIYRDPIGQVICVRLWRLVAYLDRPEYGGRSLQWIPFSVRIRGKGMLKRIF